MMIIKVGIRACLYGYQCTANYCVNLACPLTGQAELLPGAKSVIMGVDLCGDKLQQIKVHCNTFQCVGAVSTQPVSAWQARAGWIYTQLAVSELFIETSPWRHNVFLFFKLD